MSDDSKPQDAQPSPADLEAHAAAAEAVAAHQGVQTQTSEPDPAVQAATEAQAKSDAPAPGPTTGGLATPMHAEPSAEVMATRLAPDVGVGQARPIQTTTPIIGAVEGNVPMPDPSSLIAYPWAQMGVDDSFNVHGGLDVEQLQKAADDWVAKNGPGKQFVARLDMEMKPRVWRVR